jgi:creatinine amidohydrolase
MAAPDPDPAPRVAQELAKLAWPRVQELLGAGCAAILPVGSTEAHGPHLPLDTDVTISRGMALRAARMLEERGRHCLVLPAVAYSVTDFAAGFAGTLTLSAATATAHLAEILEGAARAGFAPLAVANGHLEPDHLASIRDAMARVHASTGIEVVFPDVTRRRLAERLTPEFQSGACHAGSYESSLVMADDPGSVDDAIRRALPEVDISLVDVIRAGQKNFVEAGGTQAYFGRPAEASAEEGSDTYHVLATMLVEAIESAAG